MGRLCPGGIFAGIEQGTKERIKRYDKPMGFIRYFRRIDYCAK